MGKIGSAALILLMIFGIGSCMSGHDKKETASTQVVQEQKKEYKYSPEWAVKKIQSNQRVMINGSKQKIEGSYESVIEIPAADLKLETLKTIAKYVEDHKSDPKGKLIFVAINLGAHPKHPDQYVYLLCNPIMSFTCLANDSYDMYDKTPTVPLKYKCMMRYNEKKDGIVFMDDDKYKNTTIINSDEELQNMISTVMNS